VHCSDVQPLDCNVLCPFFKYAPYTAQNHIFNCIDLAGIQYQSTVRAVSFIVHSLVTLLTRSEARKYEATENWRKLHNE
jgi:hypothetical protein